MKWESLNDDAIAEQIIAWRREFHRCPELSGKEAQTAAKIEHILQSLGLVVKRSTQHYGLVGIIEGALPGPTIALRADMDALPIKEATDLSFQSQYDGVMHACGHDAHMAVLLGAALRLLQCRSKLAGRVKLIFQPAEELSPIGGARLMLADGLLDDVRAIFGLHVWPDLPSGKVGVRVGPLMAASDRFSIKIKGKSAHAAHPHQGIDAIMAAADALHDFSHIISRKINPVATATLSIGSIQGGERYNVIASEVTMEGTVRTLDEETRKLIPVLMDDVLGGVERSYGASYELNYRLGYPVLNNWPEQTAIVQQAVTTAIGAEALLPGISPELTAEDFAVYLTKIPGAFFWLGCNSGGADQCLHNARFCLDEAMLPLGAKIFQQIVVDILHN